MFMEWCFNFRCGPQKTNPYTSISVDMFINGDLNAGMRIVEYNRGLKYRASSMKIAHETPCISLHMCYN